MIAAVVAPNFRSPQDFHQSAFDAISKFVSDAAVHHIMNGNTATLELECLQCIETVCRSNYYDASRISALIEIIGEENSHLITTLRELGDDHE